MRCVPAIWIAACILLATEPSHAQFGLAGITKQVADMVSKTITPELRDELRARAAGKPEAGKPELASVPSVVIANELKEREKAIYGLDNRQDYWQLSASVRGLTDSTVALFPKASLTPYGDVFILPNVPLQAVQGLCPGQSFSKQPAGRAQCSGFLATENRIVTAGHCIQDQTVAGLAVVFGYRMDGAEKPRIAVPKSDVYFPLRIIKRLKTYYADFAVVELDRSASPRTPLTVRTTGKVPDNSPVAVIGYPTGLPVKYAPGATVLNNSADSAFVANVDTFAGNSGSPILGHDNLVEGILVSGELDYVPVVEPKTGAKCNIAFQCTENECRGELVTRATEFAKYLAGNPK